MRIFISGGCKNGKSYMAQRLAKAQQKDKLYYVATMRSADPEDDGRIARHRLDRAGWGFETVEQPDNIGGMLEKCDSSGSFLLDSFTALLANEMFRGSGVDGRAAEKINADLAAILSAVGDIVFVSDYIYSDAIIYDPLTELYRKSLAQIDRFAAGRCEIVLESVYSNIIVHKGAEAFDAVSRKMP